MSYGSIETDVVRLCENISIGDNRYSVTNKTSRDFVLKVFVPPPICVSSAAKDSATESETALLILFFLLTCSPPDLNFLLFAARLHLHPLQ